MSSDDFQTKYSSVMESMLKAAIAETTKLFETMVDELKVEISKMKTENEELKTRCWQFEIERNERTVFIVSGESEPPPGPSDGSEKRDQAIQCDIVPSRIMLVEQCPPVNHQEIENTLHDHNYEGTTQMAFIVVKQEDSYDSKSHSVVKQEEVEQMVVCGQVSGDQPDSPQASASATEIGGRLVNQESSTGEIPTPQEKTPVALEQPCLGSNGGLQGAQNQLPELVTSIVFSLASINNNIEEDSEVSQNISATQGETGKPQSVVAHNESEVEPLQKEQPLVVSVPCPKESKITVNEQADVTPKTTGKRIRAPRKQLNKGKEFEESKSGDVEGSSQPELPVPRRRGRPPKQAKNQQQPMKENGSPTFSVPSVGTRCSSRKGKTSKPQQLSMENEKISIKTPSTESLSSIETLNPLEDQPRERCSSVTLQDAMLLVEAMTQSTVDVAAPAKTQSASHVGILQTVDEVAAEQQTPPLSVEPCKAACKLAVTELSTKDQSTIEKHNDSPVNSDITPTNELQSNINFVLPKQQHKVIPSKPTISSIPLTHVAVQSIMRALQQQSSASPVTSVATSKTIKSVSRKIITMPRSLSFLKPPKIGAPSPSQPPTVVSTVVAAQKKSILPDSLTAGLLLGTPFKASVPQTTVDPASMKLVSADPSQSTTTAKDSLSGPTQQPQVTIIIPREVSAVASRLLHSQTIIPKTKQDTAKSDALVTLSSPNLISPSHELRITVNPQIASEEDPKVLFQNKSETSEPILEYPQQIDSVSELIKAPTENIPSLNASEGPVPTSVPPVITQTVAKKLSVVIRLTRLSFPISAKEAVKVSRLPTDGSSENLKEGITKEKPSSVVMSTTPSKTLVSSTELCPGLKETPVVLPVNISQMAEKPKGIQEKASLSSEGRTPSEVSTPDFENSTLAPNTTPTENKSSADIMQLTPIATEDMSTPHSWMTKAQFLAQLAVTPVTKDPTKTSSEDSLDATASSEDTITGDKKRFHKKSILDKLQSHLKTRLQTQRSKINPCKETIRPINLRLKNDSPANKKTKKSIFLMPKDSGLVKDVTSPAKKSVYPVTCIPRRSGQSGASVGSKRTFSDPLVSSKRFKATRESTRRSTGVDVGSTTKKSTSLSPRMSSFTKQSASSKTDKSTSMGPRKSISIKESASPKNRKSTSVSPRKSSLSKQSDSSKTDKSTSMGPKKSISMKESASPKNRKSTSVSPRKSSLSNQSASSKMDKSTSLSPRKSISIKESATPKKTRSTSASPIKGSSPNESVGSKKTDSISVRPGRISSTRDGASNKSSETTSVDPKRTTLSKTGTSPQIILKESPSFCRRRCTLPKDVTTSAQIQGETNSFSLGYRITSDEASTKEVKLNPGSPSIRWPKLAKGCVSPRKTRESTPAKKKRLSPDVTGPKNNLRVVNANKLAKAAKAKIVAKMRSSSQSKLQNGAKTSQSAENSDTRRRITVKGIWTPPRVSDEKTPAAVEKKETKSPKSQNQPLVFPPSVSLFPIPVRGPTVMSPLQPLSVIGRRLLKNQCGQCGRVLSSVAALESHVRLHTGHRPFSCTLCGKGFPDTKCLKRHARVHRNGRIHVCPQCGKGFVYSFGLTKHLKMVHRRIKPFVCQICNKGFFTKRDVEAHLRMHTGEKPFHCNLCEKKFARRVELNMHLRWHNGEKRHWCSYCGKGFLDSNNLKRHKYIHTGEKPHACSHCDKCFKQSGHLKKHVKNVHKIP
nr:mucin-5AC [Pseudochaenichthys georgianus]